MKFQPTHEQIASLTEKEMKYWRFMYSGNVPFIKGKPGTAKSAIGESIARKLGLQYIDLRLSTMDNTDISLPIATPKENGISTHDMTVPHWAILANSKPCIIHFEEINRCSRSVQNATLGIIREHRIGSIFRFNENAFMMSSGNLGEADGNDVEEFSSALNNRFVHIEHKFTIKDWREGFANEHIIPSIINFVEAKSQYFAPDPKEGDTAYASPRSWSMLSDYLVSVCGPNASYKDILPVVTEDSLAFVGTAGAAFMKWLEENSAITLKDLFARYPQIKNEIRDSRVPEFFVQLKDVNILKLQESEIKNLRLFLEDVSEKKLDDQIASYFNDVVITTKGNLTLTDLTKMAERSEQHKLFFTRFKKYFAKIKTTGVAN